MSKLPLKLAVLMLAFVLAACGSLGEKADETKGWTAEKLYAEAKDELKGGNY